MAEAATMDERCGIPRRRWAAPGVNTPRPFGARELLRPTSGPPATLLSPRCGPSRASPASSSRPVARHRRRYARGSAGRTTRPPSSTTASSPVRPPVPPACPGFPDRGWFKAVRSDSCCPGFVRTGLPRTRICVKWMRRHLNHPLSGTLALKACPGSPGSPGISGPGLVSVRGGTPDRG
jgi:hypothetical protein